MHDGDGRVTSVRYEAVNAVLLNEFFKEHQKLEQQCKDYNRTLSEQRKEIEALEAGLLKVNAKLAAHQRRTVAHNQ